MMQLIHVVPQLPPNVSGVGDYAVILGRRVAEQTDGRVQSAFVQAGCSGGDAPSDALTSMDLVGQPSAKRFVEAVDALAEEGEEVAVLVHFVGYGYQQRGCPLWLVHALKRLKNARPGLRRLTMFHELYATSRKPWTSAFWTAPVQRYVATRIARLSDGLMTNREASAGWLRKHVGEAPVRVSPTFSNVGEPEDLPAYEEREPYAVVFGAASRRSELYEQHGEVLSRALRGLGIERVVDIGAPVRESITDALTIPVEATGVLPAEEVSAHLRRAAVGGVRYPLGYLTKSGIWAAYAAHGVPVVTVAERQPAAGALEEGQHFMLLRVLAGEGLGAGRRAEVSRGVKRWYGKRGHSRRAAQQMIALLDCAKPSQIC